MPSLKPETDPELQAHQPWLRAVQHRQTRIAGNSPHGDRVDGVVALDHQTPLAIAEDQMPRSQAIAASERKFQRFHVRHSSLFRFHLQPEGDGFADIGEGFLAAVALGVAARSQPR